MKPEALLKAIIEYGADEAGIKDRFGDNTVLYALCFQELVESSYIASLYEALHPLDYETAFSVAHALKGLAGNLGLNALYAADCVLVESLRRQDEAHLEQEYAAVKHELENLERIFAGEEPKLAVIDDSVDIKQQRGTNQDKETATIKMGRFLLVAAAVILAVFVIAVLSFYSVGSNYREKTRAESGQHLLETGKQIGQYLEGHIDNDWKIAQSVGKAIDYSEDNEEDAYIELLKEQQADWGVTNLMLYTESGYCVDANGETAANDMASEVIVNARDKGRVLSIVESQIIYTLPITSEGTIKGSKIVAVSAIRNMDTLLDELDFTSYKNEAWLYLTDENGVVISTLAESNPVFTFNVNTLLENQTITALDEDADTEDVFSPSAAAFYLSDGTDDNYLISIPISTDSSDAIRMRLFYIVPEVVVNDTSNDFSNQLTLFSVVIIGLLVCFAAAAFFAIYRNKKKQFAAALSAREQMFDLLVQNMRTVFGLFNTDKALPDYISANAGEVLGEEYWMIEKNEGCYCARTASGEETKMICQANEVLCRWDGKTMFKSGYLCNDATMPPSYFELILYPVGESGNAFVGIIQDVTAVHDREKATKDAMEMAKRSNDAKSRFLANMSHDIRTPMNAIMNMSSFALDSGVSPEKREEYLNTIHESSQHLLQVINDVLDMSRIESGQTVVAAEPFDLKASLQGQVESIRPLCLAKSQRLIVDLEGIHTQFVRGDALKVSQIVMNLLSNAIKFTPEGGTVTFTGTEPPSLRNEMVNLRLTVEDSGIGIPEESMQFIFEPFFRGDDRRIEELEGTGLGLPICKNYTEAMGGTIACRSEMGKGSIFTVELFFQKADEEETARINIVGERDKPFLGLSCLVAEDIATNREIAKILLEGVGFTVHWAKDGEEAVNKFENAPPKAFDVIYMDIQMPILDGYQATAMIRQSHHPQAKTIPIVAMSANVFVEDVEKARIAGMNGYIGKPIVRRELTEQTLKAMQNKKG